MVTTDTITDFLLNSGLNQSQIKQVLVWWDNEKQENESLANTFVRSGIFRPAAERTLEMMKKGFLVNVDHNAIFAEKGLEKIKSETIDFENKNKSVFLLPNSGHKSDVVFTVEQTRSHSAKNTSVTLSTFNNVGLNFDRTHGSTIQLPDKKPESEQKTSKHEIPLIKESIYGIPKVGDTLGRCLLTGVLGTGGFGTVFSALHTTLNITVAVKVLSTKDRIPDEVRQLIRREAQVLARLNHPNIVRILDFEDSERPYFIMEFVEGPSLADLIKQTGSLSFERASEIILEVIYGLSVAWNMGVVHRDIKPGNILVTKTGQAKLADLGLAQIPGLDDKVLTPDQNRPLGTCAYIAPEQIKNGSNVDFRSDMYGLGCTFYHAVTGLLPFTGKSQREVIMKHLLTKAPNPSAIAQDRISFEAGEVILKMMEKEPENRYASYDECADEIRKVKTTKPKSFVDFSIDSTVGESSRASTTSKRSKIFQWLSRGNA